MTDRAGVYGIPRFHKAAKAAGVEAIVGAEAVLADGSRLPLLVRDPRGYSNLCRLLTTASLHGNSFSLSCFFFFTTNHEPRTTNHCL